MSAPRVHVHMTVSDLTLRVQPLEPDMADALDPDLRPEIFQKNGEPKPKVTSLGWHLEIIVGDTAAKFR